MNSHTSLSRNGILGLIAALVLFCSIPASAGNGFFITTYGGRYMGLGGTYITLGGSVMSLQSNPATLLYLQNGKLEMGSALIFGTLHYHDNFNSLDYVNPSLSFTNAVTSTTFAPIPYFGYAQPINDHMAWGIAAYAQAGGGVDINDVSSLLPLYAVEPTPLVMTKTLRDQYQGAVFFKVTPGFAMAWDDFKFGVGVDFVYGSMQNEITFRSADGARQLLHYQYDGDPGFTVGGKVGLTYTWNHFLTVGYAYMLKNSFNFDGTFTETNYAGKKTIAAVKNSLTLPDRHSMGASLNYGPWTLAADANFVRYGAYFDHRRLELSEPLFPGGATVSDELINYKDQWIFNAGLEYRSGPMSYRTGWNYGRSPIRDYTVSPQDNLIAEHHAQVGIGYEAGRFTYDLAVEVAFKNTEHGLNNSDWGKQRFFSKSDGYSVDLQQTLVYFSIGYNL